MHYYRDTIRASRSLRSAKPTTLKPKDIVLTLGVCWDRDTVVFQKKKKNNRHLKTNTLVKSMTNIETPYKKNLSNSFERKEMKRRNSHPMQKRCSEKVTNIGYLWGWVVVLDVWFKKITRTRNKVHFGKTSRILCYGEKSFWKQVSLGRLMSSLNGKEYSIVTHLLLMFFFIL